MSPPPRTLADELRARSDEQLAALLAARPDLLSPPPGDVGELAVRATTSPSVWRAITRLDMFCRQTLEALLALPEPCPVERVAQLLGVDPGPALEELRTRALVWGPAQALRTVHAAHSLLREPAGLGPSARELFVGYGPARLAELLGRLGLPADPSPPQAASRLAEHLDDPNVLHALLERAPAGARTALEPLTWGPPTATCAPDPAVDWLVAHGLLATPEPTAAPRTVVLPREVALGLRGGRVHQQVAAVPPALDGPHRDPARVDSAAAGSAATLVRLVDELLTRWAGTPPPVLLGGGLGVRELRRAGAALGVPVATVRLLCALTLAAGLLERGAGPPGWTPTAAFRRWRQAEPGLQWAVLAQAWLTLDEDPAAGGQEHAWEPGAVTPSLAQARALVVRTLAAAPPGLAVTSAALLARLRWAAPHWPLAHRPPTVEAVLEQAALLGLTGLDALSAGGRALVAGRGEPRAIAAQLDGWLPERVSELLVQGDLTAIAPGPLAPVVADELRLVAEVESIGAGSVHRFSAQSIRRALQAGRTAGQIEEFLTTHSRTPLPQPLRYLIADTARQYGQVHPVPAPPAPAAASTVPDPDEPTDDRYWAGSGWAMTLEGEPADPLPPAIVAAAVRGMRGVPTRPGGAPSLQQAPPHRVRAALVDAAHDGRAVWVGYAERSGAVTARCLEPVGVVGGTVLALDRTGDRDSGGLRQLAISRITGVAAPDADTSTPPVPSNGLPTSRLRSRAAGERTSTA
jgi:hypothetical protein